MEQLTLVCDLCGRPAVRSVTLRVDGKNLVIDHCDADTRTLRYSLQDKLRDRPVATGRTRSAHAGPTHRSNQKTATPAMEPVA